jgi:putative DNA methylase
VDVVAASGGAEVQQISASSTSWNQSSVCISSDPPYYDNIGYADLSDYFYVWIRRTLCAVWPRLCSTVLVPKAEELVATPHRHGEGRG